MQNSGQVITGAWSKELIKRLDYRQKLLFETEVIGILHMDKPKYLIRPDDGEPFILNDDGTYSLEFMVVEYTHEECLIGRHSYEQLIKLGFIPKYS